MSATRSVVRARDEVREVRRQKRTALMFMAPPLIVFSLFTIAEGFGPASGWWGHAIQLVALLLLMTTAWLRSRIGGPLLIVAGAALGTWILMTGVDELGADLVSIALVALPVLISGVLFTRIDDRSVIGEPV